jgi:hypothetical protein
MALPQPKLPRYTLNLPSNGEKLIFRPFTVKEEEILYMAQDETESNQVAALRQVLEDCIIPDAKGKKFDLNKAPMFDLDYLWIKIRSKSVEESVTLPFECRNTLPEGEVRTDYEGNEYTHCGMVVQVPLNLESIEIKRDPENNPKIDLGDGLGLIMQFPNFEIIQELTKVNADNDLDALLKCVAECIEMVYDMEKTYEKEYLDKGELVQFLESLSKIQFQKIVKFFETLPVLRHTIHFKCPKCNHEVDVVLEGTKSFLASGSPMTP